MAFRSITLMKLVRNVCVVSQNFISTSVVIPHVSKLNKVKESKNEDLLYLEDPDTFGTLSGRQPTQSDVLEDEGDIKEEKFIGSKPIPSQQLTIKQYSDLIKQYLKLKRLKEAINVLEVRMLQEDRVKPSNYIYNILIGACADVGYTKKAFKLFNDMKRRALSATGDTYTCLFEACSNSPWAIDGLKNAKNLRNQMIEKGIEPNITNYNAMIKAFGRCGDLGTAFKIVDEMVDKKIKIRVHTFNHLLQACISDKNRGLRHALVVWRKMLKQREKPNIYSFNLMLKCVNECNLGSKEDIEELIQIIQEETPLAIQSRNEVKVFQLEAAESLSKVSEDSRTKTIEGTEHIEKRIPEFITNLNENLPKDPGAEISPVNTMNTLDAINTLDTVQIQFVDKLAAPKSDRRIVPNLLSKEIKMQQVLSLQEVETVQDKFAIVGGQEDFLKEMEVYNVKPDVKTFTQMLVLVDNNTKAENKLMEAMKANEVNADIDFYNMLIKKRCLRSDYDNAEAVMDIIEKEDKIRKRRYFYNKKLRLKPNVMTYGVLAMSCKTQESAVKLISEMKDKQLKINIQILGTLLRQGTAHNQFSYIVYVMNTVKEENIPVNDIFLKHLEAFNDKCNNFIQQGEENRKCKRSESFEKGYKRFSEFYTRWLKDVNVKEALEPEHPWQQFREDYPESVQHSNVKIIEPKKFYKQNRKYVKYTPRL